MPRTRSFARCGYGATEIDSDTKGAHPFEHGHLDVLGGDYYTVNVACIDDLDATELADAPVTYFDGRNDAWQSPPAETRHL